jgi:hypothetical protein
MNAIDIMADLAMGRIAAVRAAGRTATIQRVTCSACGPLSRDKGQGTASHAVAFPGHLVTVMSMQTTTYIDDGSPIDARTERSSESPGYGRHRG